MSLGDWTTRIDHPNDPRNDKEFCWVTEIDIDIDRTTMEHWSLPVIEIDGYEYAVAEDEEEAIKAAEEYIRESVWAFNADFILRHSFIGIGRSDKLIKALKQIQGELCEDANELMYSLVKDEWEDFVNDAIEADGIGHFLAPYDDQEQEISDLWFEHIHNTYDDEAWDSDMVHEEFVERIADALGIETVTSGSWLFYRIN